jgi:small subunit ribosomal protein S8
MLTRIRNGLQRSKAHVDIPATRICRGILEVLKAEGFIRDFDQIEDDRQGVIRIQLRYGPDGEQVVTHLERVSKPSRRVYRKADDVEPVLGGLGVSILSTPQGILSDRDARTRHVGGEWLCSVW